MNENSGAERSLGADSITHDFLMGASEGHYAKRIASTSWASD
jgi:hypothetical protein